MHFHLFWLCLFFPSVCVREFLRSLSMNHFNSLQSASRGHSQHSVQTDSTHTHTNSHADDSCPLRSKGEEGKVRAHGVEADREGRDGRKKNMRKKGSGKGKYNREGMTDVKKARKRQPWWWRVLFCLLLFIPINSAALTIAAFDWGRERNWWEIGIDTPPVFPCEERTVEFSFQSPS